MEDHRYINLQEASVHTRDKNEIDQMLEIKGGFSLLPIEQTDK